MVRPDKDAGIEARLRAALQALVDALHEVGPDASAHVGQAEEAAIHVLAEPGRRQP